MAFYFAWQSFYLQALLVPAVAGLLLWWRRPADLPISDDVWVPYFSLLAVVWGILFVHAWRRRQAALGFRWGTDVGSSWGDGRVARRDELRPDFEGTEAISEVSGACIGLQASAHRVAASTTQSCSLSHIGLQAEARLVAPLHRAASARAVDVAAPSVEQ